MASSFANIASSGPLLVAIAVAALAGLVSFLSPCVLESSALDSVYKSTKDSGVAFIGVNSRDNRDQAVAFLKSRLSYPSLFDPAGRVALEFRDVSNALPSTVIVDRQGRVAAVINASVNRDGLTALLNRVAAGT